MSNNKKSNILFIIPSLRWAGAETQAMSLVNDIDNDIYNKTLVSFEEGLDQLDSLDRANVDFFHFKRKNKYDFFLVRKIANIIDERNIDVIHCTLQISLLFAWLALRLSKNKARIVLTIHTTSNVSLKKELIDKLLYKPMIMSCARVIFVCKSQAEFWIRKYSKLNKLATVIYNGVDIDSYQKDDFRDAAIQWRHEHKIQDATSVITCVAGFRKEKGHLILLDALSQLKHKDIVLVLAGDGVLRDVIEAKIKANMLENVILLGEISDVRPVLAASDATILASTAVETFSIAMLESMAMDVPVIATNIGGIGEAVITDRTGALIPPNDVSSLANAIDNMISSPEKWQKMGRLAKKDVIEKFSKNAMVLNTEALLKNLIKG